MIGERGKAYVGGLNMLLMEIKKGQEEREDQNEGR